MVEELPPPREPPYREFARAPLAPIALATAAGLGVDRFLEPPLEGYFAVAAIGLVAWAATRKRSTAVVFLSLAFAALAGAHRQAQRTLYADDDIGNFASTTPGIVKLRGFLDESPSIHPPNRSEFFGPARRVDRATSVLTVREVSLGSDSWSPFSGRVRLSVERDVAIREPGLLDGFEIGDEVEVIGLLSKPNAPANPGERDYASFLLDSRIRAEVRVTKGGESVTRLAEGSELSWGRFLANLRGRFTRVIRETMPPDDRPLAQALLLGDQAATGREDWDAFARTGVIHVLAISGQHLVALAGAVWLVLRLAGVSRRRGAIFVLALIVVYAALTGGRPSANRAAVMVAILCGSVLVRRPASIANTFSLAWIVVVALDPCDAISMGSLLSFISVFVLIWGAARWLAPRPLDPIVQLKREARPGWVNILREIGYAIFVAYVVNVILVIANSPMVMAQQNMAPPVGMLIGPPVVLLTTIALLAGFVQLFLGLLSPLLAMPFAWVTGWSLAISKEMVLWADALPGGSVYVPDVPEWWVAGFYLLLALVVLVSSKFRIKLLLALAAWTMIGLVGVTDRSSDELRVAFLSVGHGGCTVLETPDGRVLLYDAGTMAGPDAVRRVIAPYLWHRGVRRIDELFLSHADLDHYNGVAELLRRFPIGQVTLTPSFASKPVHEVAEVMLILEKHRVPVRVAVAGETFAAGEVQINVLHPPLDGPGSSENERSLVLNVRHRSHSILLTGDLEKAGTTVLLSQPPPTIDVLMAPHHGSPAALPQALMKWAQPKLVVVSRGHRASPLVNAPEAWDTWTHGAIIFHSHASGLVAETFRSKQRVVLKRGK